MEIVYQDKRIVVAVKPAGVLSTDEAGGMPELLRRELGTDCIRTVHRLDAQVSGLMVFARSVKAASLLSEQIRHRQFGKEYLAVIHGVPAEKSGTLRDLLGRDKTRRITYVADAPDANIQEAILDYEVLASCEGFSLVKVLLHTGRTHQIRVQFASRGWPLVGDRKYGTGTDECPIALWSYQLSFTHPETERPMTFRHFPPETAPWDRFTRGQMLGREA
ncbi:MAG: RNA pseudouridine synthase [Clostridiales bacterium]|nr:RNA pseudouridine synthase [Candidatus Cacconaster stercorequi]